MDTGRLRWFGSIVDGAEGHAVLTGTRWRKRQRHGEEASRSPCALSKGPGPAGGSLAAEGDARNRPSWPPGGGEPGPGKGTSPPPLTASVPSGFPALRAGPIGNNENVALREALPAGGGGGELRLGPENSGIFRSIHLSEPQFSHLASGVVRAWPSWGGRDDFRRRMWGRLSTELGQRYFLIHDAYVTRRSHPGRDAWGVVASSET